MSSVTFNKAFNKSQELTDYIVEKVDNGTFQSIGILTLNPVPMSNLDWFVGRSGQKNSAWFSIANKQVKWRNGATLRFFSADFTEQLRGHQFDCLVVVDPEQVCKTEAFTSARLGLRLGDNPQLIALDTNVKYEYFIS